jgi:formylmethanofuran dehydrogenase subunit B
MSGEQVFRSVTCLGCGCGCDDLEVRVRDGRIVALSPPCPVARHWFGDGVVPAEIRVDGRDATLEQAIEAAAALLGGAARPMVLLAPDLTTRAHRFAIAIADLLRAEADGATSDTAASVLLAAQRRGRAGATLGEIKNRADVVLFWAVDPRERYPRFLERYAAAASSTHAASRAHLSVSVGPDRGPAGAEIAAEFPADRELDALAVMRAVIQGRKLEGLPEALVPAERLAERMLLGKYVAIVTDAEPGRRPRDDGRTDSLLGLTQQLNDRTRAALFGLRAGGNRTGVESALTWQSGYPMRVSFREGYPRYRPGRSGLDRLAAGSVDALLVAGVATALGTLPLDAVPVVVIGPGASTVAGARVAIDTGTAGIHESGMGYRMDEVPLPLTPVLVHPRASADTLSQLLGAMRRRMGGSAR